MHSDPVAPVILGVTGILAFAIVGRTLGVIDDSVFSAVVLMVIVTTLVAPPWLKLAIGRATPAVVGAGSGAHVPRDTD